MSKNKSCPAVLRTQTGRPPIRSYPDNEDSGKVIITSLPPKDKEEIMSQNELTAKIRELRSLQALIEEAEQEAEAIKDAIKAHMGDSEELRAGEYKITWKPVTSSRIDTTALRKAMPEVAQQFTRQTTAKRFLIA